MKKVITVLISAVFLFVLSIPVFAEEVTSDGHYKFQLPDDYELVSTQDSENYYEKDNENKFSVNYYENDEDFNVCKLSEKDIEELSKERIYESEDVMDSMGYDYNGEILSCDVVKVANGSKALRTDIKAVVTMNGTTLTFYQTVYEFSGVENHYVFTYSTNIEENAHSMDDAFNSIEIEEPLTTGDLSVYIAVGVILLLVIWGIIRFIRTPKSRMKNEE
ncbi:MAG: hypothetical protein ACI4IF_02580 [Acutalibacteraceae bacterium]